MAIGTTGGQMFFVRTGLIAQGPNADLAISQFEDVDPATQGSTLRYRVAVTNSGPGVATNVVVNEHVAARVVSALASVGTCTNDALGIRCALGTLMPQTGATIDLMVTATNAGTLMCTGRVSGDIVDLDLGNNVAVVLTTVYPAAGKVEPLTLNISANDLVYDSKRNRIYVSIPQTLLALGGAIAIIDPESGAVSELIPFPGNPGRLAISGGGEFLYVHVPDANRVRRIVLNEWTTDVDFAVGAPLLDWAVQPGSSRVLVASFYNSSVVAYMDGQLSGRAPAYATVSALTFSQDGEILFTYDGYTSAAALGRMVVRTNTIDVLDGWSGAIPAFGTTAIKEAGGVV
jgi:uncharacterized repeat protein (TIGR01451 family)